MGTLGSLNFLLIHFQSIYFHIECIIWKRSFSINLIACMQSYRTNNNPISNQIYHRVTPDREGGVRVFYFLFLRLPGLPFSFPGSEREIGPC